MRAVVYFFLLFVLSVIESILAVSRHGLVNPQSACNVRCENGGMCAFSFENPQLHSCICLMGVYEGDRCQFQVGVPRDSSNFFRQSQYETTPSQRRSPPPAPTQVVDYRERQREMERLRDKQIRREYEQTFATEAVRRRVEMSRPIGVQRSGSNGEEMERINEMRRRDEEMRRIAAKRREEERRREQEQRLREEERRREFARLEEQRIREEQRMFEKQKMNMMQPNDRNTMKEMTMGNRNIDSASTENDVGIPNLEDWDYKSDEEDTTHDYLHRDDQEAGDGDTNIYGRETTVGKMSTSTERSQAETLSGVTRVIEMAADKTVMIHGMDMLSTTVGPGEDDYWDHSVKGEYEDLKVAERANSNHRSDSAPASMSDSVHQFTPKEGEEGWMMMKRVDEESSAATFVFMLSTVLSLIFRIW